MKRSVGCFGRCTVSNGKKLGISLRYILFEMIATSAIRLTAKGVVVIETDSTFLHDLRGVKQNSAAIKKVSVCPHIDSFLVGRSPGSPMEIRWIEVEGSEIEQGK